MPSDSEQNFNMGNSSLRPLCIVAGVIILLWIVDWYLLVNFFQNWQERGQFGDMFGSINSLFSGLAFGGVVYTILLQRQELALQRKELELTREQLARAADAQEQSEKALRLQVDMLQRTAQLNALNSLIEHYLIKIKDTDIASEQAAARKQRRLYIDELEAQLRALIDVQENKKA